VIASGPVDPVLLLLLPIVWVGVLLLLAHSGGWAAIASEYPSRHPFSGHKWRFQSAQVGWASYGNCLTLGVSERGFFMQPYFPFRPGHPPILVPWADIHVEEAKLLFWRYVDLRFRRVPGRKVRIAKRLAEKLRAAAGPAWPGSAAETGAPIVPS
jgi:hypothetical protein